MCCSVCWRSKARAPPAHAAERGAQRPEAGAIHAEVEPGHRRDVPPERVVEAVRQTGAKLVGLSALMTTTVPNMQATIEALPAAKLECKVMVGGAVLTPELAQELGADGYAPDAMGAVRYAGTVLDATKNG